MNLIRLAGIAGKLLLCSMLLLLAFAPSSIHICRPKLRPFDGRISGNGKLDMPYKIWANYHYSKQLDNLVSSCLLDALNEYNNNKAPWRIPLNGTTVYVIFELNAISTDSNFKTNANDDTDTIGRVGNWVTVGTPSTITAWGGTSEYGIILNYDSISSKIGKTSKKDDLKFKRKFLKSVFIHEIGHSLGGVDGDPGAMGNNDLPHALEDADMKDTSADSSSLSFVTPEFVRILLLRANMPRNSELDKDERYKDSLTDFCRKFSSYQKRKGEKMPLPPNPKYYGTVGKLLSDSNFFPVSANHRNPLH